jgi:hypothetical protein
MEEEQQLQRRSPIRIAIRLSPSLRSLENSKLVLGSINSGSDGKLSFLDKDCDPVAEEINNLEFDYVFAEQETNARLFEISVDSLVDDFVNGENISVVCHGATCSGKSSTMFGYPNKGEGGLLLEALRKIFGDSGLIGKVKGFTLEACEIYSENLRDLFVALDDKSKGKERISLGETPHGLSVVRGLRVESVRNFEEAKKAVQIPIALWLTRV